MSRRAPGPAAEERRYLRVAAIAAALLVVATVGVFLKENPFASPYEIKGVFTTSNQLRSNSAVRIGGLDVGKVSKIEAGDGNTSVVTMEITDRDVPIRSDAELAIEPRLVLEGNFYVKVTPGSPGAPELADGGTVPLAVRPSRSSSTRCWHVRRTRRAPRSRASSTSSPPGSGPPGRPAAPRAAPVGAELDCALGSITQVSEARAGDAGRATCAGRCAPRAL